MAKVTLDISTFKALASDTRLSILRALDGKKMNLKDLVTQTNLNKATLHEHLVKLNEAGLIKRKERQGHKWVYYKLTWKGEGLLHPENTRIVLMFATTFVTIAVGMIQLINFVKGKVVAKAVNTLGTDTTAIYATEESGREILAHSVDAPVANVSLTNQTAYNLSQVVTEKLYGKGVLGNSITPGDIKWGASSGYVSSESVDGIISSSSTVATDSSYSVPSSMFAVVHDPALSWIAVACIVIAVVLFSIAIWRLLKNKTPKL